MRVGALSALIPLLALTVVACTPSSSGQGDGKWHIALTARQKNHDANVASAARLGQPLTEGAALPPAMGRVPMPNKLLSVGTGNRGLFEPMAFGIISGESCDATYPEMTTGLQDLGLTTLSTGYKSQPGSQGAPPIVAGWLVVQQSDGAGVSVTFTPGPLGADSCNVQGIGFTPVHLAVTGSVTAAGDAMASVGCLAMPGVGLVIGMWGASIGGHTIGIYANFKGAAVGQNQLDKNTSSTNLVLYDLPIYGYTNLLGLALLGQKVDDTKIAAVTDATATLAQGMASGSLALTYRSKAGSGSITGTFMCGTYPLTAKEQAPAPSPTPGAAALPKGFPAAFPAYPGSTLVKADSTDAGTATLDSADWTTTDSLDKVYAFYNDALQKGDWQPDIGGFTRTGNSGFLLFKSRSVANLGGALSLDSKKQPGKVLISVLINIPK